MWGFGFILPHHTRLENKAKGVGFMKKWTTALILCGALTLGAMGTIPHIPQMNVSASTFVNALRDGESSVSSSEVYISNPKLESRLKRLLGVDGSTPLKSDSIVNSSTYSNTDTSAIETSLDLSGLGINSITELCQFEWPETLISINLAHNSFGNDSLDNILNFCAYESGQSVRIGEGDNAKDVFVPSNLKAILKNINLSFNNIDLTQVPTSTLENEKYIWGFQGLNEIFAPSSESNSDFKLVTLDELEKAQYYFRDTDFSYVKGSISVNGFTQSSLNENLKKVVSIANKFGTGDIKITLSGQPLYGHYKSWSKTLEFTSFEAKLLEPIVIERNKKTPQIPNGIISITPSTLGYEIVGSPNTKVVGNHIFNIKVIKRNASGNVLRERYMPLPYTVVDTTAPTLSLVGAETIYWSKNKPFDFDKYKATAEDSGDSINDWDYVITDKAESELVDSDYQTRNTITRVTNLDITKLSDSTSPYYIKYYCTDASGNSATPITRYIYIQEQALDTIVLRSNTKDLTVDSEITLEVKPDSNIQMTNYSGFRFEYKWYENGTLKYTTKGDSINAKSTQTFVFDDTGLKEIKVVLVATKDETSIEVQSQTLYLDIVSKIDNTQIIIISCSIAILLIIIFFSVRVIIKARRAKKGIAKKAKTSTYAPSQKPPQQNKQNITIIQGTNPNGDGGNVNSRPPENSNDNSFWGR